MTSPHLSFYPKGLPERIRAPQTTLVDNLRISALRYPDRPALVFYNGVLSYCDLQRDVRCMAGYLQQECGVAKGDRVLLYTQNCPQFTVAFYAVMSLGAAVVPVNAMSTHEELAYYFENSGARLAFCAADLYSNLRPCVDSGLVTRVILHQYRDYLSDPRDPLVPGWIAVAQEEVTDPAVVTWAEALAAEQTPMPAAFDADQMCVLPYTSGTTGHPKGCIHTHRTLGYAIYSSSLWRALNAESVFLSVAPMFHMLGLQSGMNMPILLGATTVILPRWDRDMAARLIDQWGVSVWGAPPAMIIDFFAKPDIADYDLSRLSLIFGGGAAMPEAVSRTLKEDHGIAFNESYGLTETSAFLHANPVHRNKRQCLGVPTFGVDSRVVDPETLEPLPLGEVGELITSGPQVMEGYWHNDEANRESFLERDGRRFFRTGDLACIDEDGYFFMKDRLKRMINVSGYKVWPAEVENFMYDHPAVQEACVIGVPDSRRGEVVMAILVVKDRYRGQVTEEQVIDWAREKMAVYKAPRRVEFVDALPKSGAGKILWRQLQDEQRALVGDGDVMAAGDA